MFFIVKSCFIALLTSTEITTSTMAIIHAIDIVGAIRVITRDAGEVASYVDHLAVALTEAAVD